MFEIDKMPFSCTNLRKDLGEAERRNRQPSCSSSCGAPFCCDLWPRVFCPLYQPIPDQLRFFYSKHARHTCFQLHTTWTPDSICSEALSPIPLPQPPFPSSWCLLFMHSFLFPHPTPTARSTPQPNLIMPVETDQDGREMAKDKSHKSTLCCR